MGPTLFEERQGNGAHCIRGLVASTAKYIHGHGALILVTKHCQARHMHLNLWLSAFQVSRLHDRASAFIRTERPRALPRYKLFSRRYPDKACL